MTAGRASERTVYVCPGCASPLTLRRGDIRSPHFAHRASPPCSSESALHRGAKALIARIFQRRLNRPDSRLPRLAVPCSGVGPGLPSVCPHQAWFNLSELAYDEVAQERTTTGGLRPDVLLLRNGEPVLGIEVLVSHPVDAQKAGRTTYPWVELEATRILASPRSWKPSRRSHPWTGTCQACQWMARVAVIEVGAPEDAGWFAAELTATLAVERLEAWRTASNKRARPRIVWPCPSCRGTCRRVLYPDRLVALARATSLGPPILPEVRLMTATDRWVSFQFESNGTCDRGTGVRPLPSSHHPTFRFLPDYRHPLRLRLCGTNRPLAFLCPRCGSDCTGDLPPSWSPVPHG